LSNIDVSCDNLHTEYDKYSREDVPFCQGAEAQLFRCTFFGRPAILKERFVKKYRHIELNSRLTKERIRAELKAILKCQEVKCNHLRSQVIFTIFKIAIRVPAVYFVNLHKNEIIYEQIISKDGSRL
jgi:TP53 regulating kinase-like protein